MNRRRFIKRCASAALLVPVPVLAQRLSRPAPEAPPSAPVPTLDDLVIAVRNDNVAAVHAQRLGDLRANPHDRIERGHRLLEDEADTGASHAPHLRLW